MNKICKKCDGTKEATEFYKHSGTKDGYRNECKECTKESQRNRRVTNRDALNENDRKRYAKTKRFQHLSRTYGLDKNGYDELLKSQNGVCAICKNPPEFRNLYVDHDHSCCPSEKSCGNCVRALLCRSCNLAISYFKDNPDLMLSGASYILSFKDVLRG